MMRSSQVQIICLTHGNFLQIKLFFKTVEICTTKKQNKQTYAKIWIYRQKEFEFWFFSLFGFFLFVILVTFHDP